MRRLLVYGTLLMASLCTASSPEDEPSVAPRCEDIGKAPRAERCHLVRSLCSEESRKGTLSLDYLSAYYCHIDGNGYRVQLLFWTMLCFVGAILFSLLGDTAEKYFSPALTQICQQVPKMRPRFAGVTVLAFANGAPDLSATINAIKTCKFNLSLGALTGAGMFVNCFVAGWIILISGGARCRGATIRDVTTYFLTIFGVLMALLVHRMGITVIVLAFLLYGGFVAIVFGADEWHEQGRPDFWSKPIGRIASSFRYGETMEDAWMTSTTGPVWATYDDDGEQPSAIASEQLLLTATRDEEELMRRHLPTVWAQLSPKEYRQQALAEMAGSDDDLYDYPLDDRLMAEATSEGPSQMENLPDASSPQPLGADVMPFETEHPSETVPCTGGASGDHLSLSQTACAHRCVCTVSMAHAYVGDAFDGRQAGQG